MEQIPTNQPLRREDVVLHRALDRDAHDESVGATVTPVALPLPRVRNPLPVAVPETRSRSDKTAAEGTAVPRTSRIVDPTPARTEATSATTRTPVPTTAARPATTTPVSGPAVQHAVPATTVTPAANPDHARPFFDWSKVTHLDAPQTRRNPWN